MENNEQNNQIIIYQADDGTPGIDVRFQGETVWLTQAQLVNLFGSSKENISEHIKHIFEERELERDSVVRKFRTTAADGKTYEIEHYNLDMIISLGFCGTYKFQGLTTPSSRSDGRQKLFGIKRAQGLEQSCLCLFRFGGDQCPGTKAHEDGGLYP